MRRRSELQDIALGWIRRLPPGKRFCASDIYKYLASEHYDKVKAHQAKNNEPRFQYDARWAIMTAKTAQLILHVRRNEWERQSLAIDIDL